MLGRYILKFKDVEGNPIKFTPVTAINYSNVFSLSEMNLTNDDGIAVFWFFTLVKTIKIQTYIGYHKLPITQINRGKIFELIVTEECIDE